MILTKTYQYYVSILNIQYHKINMARLREDLKCTAFVCAPANDPSKLYQQYIDCVTRVMDCHAPVITKTLRRPTPEWITC